MFGLFAQFQDIYAGTYHSQAAELKLFLTPLTEVGRLVKHGFTGHLAVFHPDILHITDHATALVHVQQYRIPAVLLHTHARCQHAASVTVQAVI